MWLECDHRLLWDEGLNQMVERVNNTIRDSEKTFRGMDNDKSAQIMAGGMLINYNFIGPHKWS
jgi:transposase-like protein